MIHLRSADSTVGLGEPIDVNNPAADVCGCDVVRSRSTLQPAVYSCSSGDDSPLHSEPVKFTSNTKDNLIPTVQFSFLIVY